MRTNDGVTENAPHKAYAKERSLDDAIKMFKTFALGKIKQAEWAKIEGTFGCDEYAIQSLSNAKLYAQIAGWLEELKKIKEGTKQPKEKGWIANIWDNVPKDNLYKQVKCSNGCILIASFDGLRWNLMDELFLRPLMDDIVAWKELEQQVMREKV